jgi:hypothetical protein
VYEGNETLGYVTFLLIVLRCCLILTRLYFLQSSFILLYLFLFVLCVLSVFVFVLYCIVIMTSSISGPLGQWIRTMYVYMYVCMYVYMLPSIIMK